MRFVKNKISIFKNETHSGGAGVRRPSGGAPPLRGCTAPHGVSDDDCSGLTQAGYGFRGAPPLEGCATPHGVRRPSRGGSAAGVPPVRVFCLFFLCFSSPVEIHFSIPAFF